MGVSGPRSPPAALLSPFVLRPWKYPWGRGRVGGKGAWRVWAGGRGAAGMDALKHAGPPVAWNSARRAPGCMELSTPGPRLHGAQHAGPPIAWSSARRAPVAWTLFRRAPLQTPSSGRLHCHAVGLPHAPPFVGSGFPAALRGGGAQPPRKGQASGCVAPRPCPPPHSMDGFLSRHPGWRQAARLAHVRRRPAARHAALPQPPPPGRPPRRPAACRPAPAHRRISTRWEDKTPTNLETRPQDPKNHQNPNPKKHQNPKCRGWAVRPTFEESGRTTKVSAEY